MFDSLKNVVATLIDIVRVRLDLLGTEIQEDFGRLIRRLYLSAAALLLGTLTLAFAGIAIIAASGPEHRVLACALVASTFALATAFVFMRLRQAMSAATPLFAATLSELAKDREELRARAASPEPKGK